MKFSPVIHPDHLEGVLFASRYRAPADQDPVARQIQANREEIELVTGGGGWFNQDGRLVEVGCGAILWHLPGDTTIDRSRRGDPYECLVLSFPVKENRPRMVPRLSQWDSPAEVVAFSQEVLAGYHAEGGDRRKKPWDLGPSVALRADGGDRRALCWYAYARLLWQASQYIRTAAVRDLPPALQAALRFAGRAWAEDMPLERLAAAAGVSVPHLHTLFRHHLQTTPHQYLLRRRLQEARNLLVTGDRPIKEICDHCGFNDLVHFCRSFRNAFGLPPGAYRRRHTGPVPFEPE